MRAGAIPWLLGHELRLTWREVTAHISGGWLLALLLVVLALLHWGLVALLRGVKVQLAGPVPPDVVTVVGLILLAIFPLSLTFGINRSVTTFFERGDMDLLASSPLPSRTIFASRVLGIAAALALFFGIVAVPLGSTGLLVGLPRLLGVYPLVIALALTAASLGILVTLGLVRLLGARRARVVAQLLAALAGAILFIVSQLPNVLNLDGSDMQAQATRLMALFEEGSLLGPGSLVWLPARALFFDPVAVVVVLAVALTLTWLTTVTLHGAFMRGGRETLTAPSRRRDAPTSLAFRDVGLTRLVLLKEWRLVLRDPYLISRVLLQVLYLLPLFLVLPNRSERLASIDMAPGVAGVLVLMGAALVGELTRIAVSGEEAADLLAASPVPAARLERLKLVAVLLPVWAIALIPLVGLGLQRPLLALLAGVGLAAATLSTGLIRLWNPAPATRADLFKRTTRRGDPVLTFIEFLVAAGWAVSVALIASGIGWSFWVPVAALALLGVAYVYGRRRGGLVRRLNVGGR